MRKSISALIAIVLAICILPLAIALSDDDDTGGNVTVDPTDCEAAEPTIYIDPTARCWEPNDETAYTTDVYGDEYTSHSVDCYISPKRGNYVFTGETLKYFVIVENSNGPDDIENVFLRVDGTGVGSCAPPAVAFTDFSSFGPSFPGWDSATMAQYICKLVISESMNGLLNVEVRAVTGAVCGGTEETTLTIETLNFNPSYSIGVDGTVNFGTATPGSVAASTNSISLNNTGEVMMDTYIAASDYFTDPSNPFALCGDGNGIPYWVFSYYAMKGTVNSGFNDNTYPGLGETVDDPKITGDICVAATDEYTTLPSHSGRIDDMCRIINWDEDASLLGAGNSMSLLFQLDVPSPCDGTFTNGRFYFVGEVV